MTMRSVLILLFAAASASTVACGSGDDAGTSGSRLSRGRGNDDDDDDDRSSKSSKGAKSSKPSSSPTSQKTGSSTSSPATPDTSSTSTPLPASPVPANGGDKGADVKAAGEQLNACLIGCADDACVDQCFADLAGNLAGGGGGGGDANVPCCTPGGGLFLCALGQQCGDAGCKALPFLDGFCEGQ